MSKSVHIKTGKTGEDLAAKFITGSGFTILSRNWRHGHCEVDIIAFSGSVLHFFEVKTRTGSPLAYPEMSVNGRKLAKLKEAAEAYMAAFPQWKYLQLNVLAITIKEGREPEIFLIEDVS